jgi:hypothetical protein
MIRVCLLFITACACLFCSVVALMCLFSEEPERLRAFFKFLAMGVVFGVGFWGELHRYNGRGDP